MELPLVGMTVAMCIIDYGFSIRCIDEPKDYTLRIECPFTLSVGDNQRMLLNPEETMNLTPALGVLHKTVQTAIAEESGLLRVEFLGEYFVEVAPHDQFEAWNLSGHDGLLIVCLPGGGLAKWKAIK